MSTRKAKAPVIRQHRFALPEDVPDLVRAASLGLAVARHCKADTWAGFAAAARRRDEETLARLAELDIETEEWRNVVDHEPVLQLLSVKPLVTVAVCPECGDWVLVAGAAPTRCKTTLRCTGKPVRKGIATKQKDT